MTGLIKEFFIFASVIFLHELGHMTMAYFYGWKIDKIVIYPFGGMTKFNELLNRPIQEEFWILVGGPLVQIIYMLTIFFFFHQGWIREPIYFLFRNYHTTILLFNLLPIIPLDGSKLVKLGLEKILSYQVSYQTLLKLSWCMIIFLCFVVLVGSLDINFLMMLLILTYQVLEAERQKPILFHKFLLERFLYVFSFPKRKQIKGLDVTKMSRDTKHIFQTPEKTYTEREILRKLFDTTRLF